MHVPIDSRAGLGAFFILTLLCITGLMKAWGLFSILTLLLTAHLFFFRDPKRRIPDTDLPLSPADGKVRDILCVEAPDYLNGEALRIGISLSVFDNHITRAPLTGKIEFQKYVPGEFRNAFTGTAEKNESHWTGLAGVKGRVLIRQMAGMIARRIRCDVRTGDSAQRGEKIGIICYGSRVEFYAPKRSFLPLVRPGDRVRGGQTILGEWQ